MTNTLAPTWSSCFGMPTSGRVRVSALRALPTTGLSKAGLSKDAGHTAVLMAAASAHESAFAQASGYTPVTADVRIEDTFPGTSAWSPPI